MAKRKVTKRRTPRPRSTRSPRLDELDNNEIYARAAQLAWKNGEADHLVRHVMGAALSHAAAAGDEDALGTVLAQDLSLLRWTLKKMRENRMVAEAVDNS